MKQPDKANVIVHVLAGGLGTRLSHIVSDVPKPMAPIRGIPFLEWQVKWLVRNGFSDIVLLVGHKKETVIGHFGDGGRFGTRIRYSEEKELLGTGGAVIQSLKQYPSEHFIVLNGDTFFNIDLRSFYEYHSQKLPAGAFSVALKYKEDTKRYGAVRIDENYLVGSLVEKDPGLEEGLINGGIYIGRTSDLASMEVKKCSLETEIFPGLIKNGKMYGIPFGDKFIDIGVPEDYYKADRELPEWFGTGKKPALFLDRDGVIIEDTGYVSASDRLNFLEPAEGLVRRANDNGWLVVVVSNQAGVGKGKITEEDVLKVNHSIREHYAGSGLRIDQFYYCPFHRDAVIERYKKISLMRKPEPGMLLQAAENLDIDLQNSLMIGDKDSDVIRLPYLDCRLIEGKYKLERRDRVTDWDQLAKIFSTTK